MRVSASASFFLILFLCSCSHKNERLSKKQLWHQYEAKLYDIPIVLNAQPLVDVQSYEQEKIIIAYQTALSLERIIEFYTQEMERHGWRQIASFVGTESLLQFEKPQRMASISIRTEHNNFAVIIFVSSKKV